MSLIFIGFISCNINIENNSFDLIKGKLVSNISTNQEQAVVNELQKFIPENYLLLDSLSSDLNQDGLKDYLLILKNKGEVALSNVVEHPEKRPLLILIQNKSNQLELKSKNENVVYCVDCGGMMGDPYVTMVYKDGYFSIEHYGGSTWRWTRIITFKYNKTKDDWFLHKDSSESFRVDDTEKVQTNIKTTKDFGVVRFNEFDIYRGG